MMDIDIERLKADSAYWDECGAPEDATHYRRGKIEPHWYNLQKRQYWDWSNGWVDSGSLEMRQIGWHELVSRPTKPAAPEWDGEGLPPVGVECEFRSKGGSLNNGDQIEWIKCKVIAITKRYAILCHIRHGYAVDHECSHSLGQIEFRPIRTKEQRQREELIGMLTEGNNMYRDDAEEYADAIIAAGYRKQERD